MCSWFQKNYWEKYNKEYFREKIIQEPRCSLFRVLKKIKNKSNQVRKSILKLRLEVIEGYGGKCELCGEDNPYFLTIDHINGEGSKERKMIMRWEKLYRKLRNENYPRDNYRLLCYNCNCALGFKRITEEEILQQNNIEIEKVL